MKPGLDLKQDFLVDYKTDPYEKKNASAGNEKIVKALYEVALKYDTITPCIPEVPYGKGRDGFKAPKEWKEKKKVKDIYDKITQSYSV